MAVIGFDSKITEVVPGFIMTLILKTLRGDCEAGKTEIEDYKKRINKKRQTGRKIKHEWQPES